MLALPVRFANSESIAFASPERTATVVERSSASSSFRSFHVASSADSCWATAVYSLSAPCLTSDSICVVA
jgi:hypothetical protein